MSAEENKAIVRRYLEESWNQRNLAVIDELIAPDLIQHDPQHLTPGRQGIQSVRWDAVQRFSRRSFYS